MQTTSFIAASAEEAVAQIRAKLGPEAVVLNVRPVPPNGLARLWQKPSIEVLACIPEAPPEMPPPVMPEDRRPAAVYQRAAARPGAENFSSEEETAPAEGDWRVIPVLRKSGMQPMGVQQVLDRLQARFGELPPETLAREIDCVCAVLDDSWRPVTRVTPGMLHVFVGPPGSGKTTYLSKWLTQTALVQGRSARVWRLDGATANMAESLSVYGEILGVGVERVWDPETTPLAEEAGFIDLPGVDWRNPQALDELALRLAQFGQTQIHLVLNGAYEMPLLLAQCRAFAKLPIEDLTLTHLDEEVSWGKIWNLVLGTNFSIRHLSAGQNIPGDLCEATPPAIFARQFPGNQYGNRFANQGAGIGSHI